MNKKWKLKENDENRILEISKKFNLTYIVAQKLAEKNLTDKEIEIFLNPTRKDFHNPFKLPDMEVAVNRILKAMENKESFDKNRNEFVKFVQGIYSKKITENLSGNKMENDWEQKLGLDKLYISVENKFDLLYRNIKLDNHNTMFRIIIILLVVLIIIGTINLGNYLM